MEAPRGLCSTGEVSQILSRALWCVLHQGCQTATCSPSPSPAVWHKISSKGEMCFILSVVLFLSALLQLSPGLLFAVSTQQLGKLLPPCTAQGKPKPGRWKHPHSIRSPSPCQSVQLQRGKVGHFWQRILTFEQITTCIASCISL